MRISPPVAKASIGTRGRLRGGPKTICLFLEIAKNTARLAATVFFLSALLVPKLEAQAYLNPSLPVRQRVDDLMSRMTEDEKIGQMMQADLSAVRGNPGDISSYRIGSILSGSGSDPAERNAVCKRCRRSG